MLTFFYPRYHYVCCIDGTANMALDLFRFLRKIYPLFLLKYLCNHFRIGIKDKFSCFMMVLNYRSAVLKPRSPIDSLKPS